MGAKRPGFKYDISLNNQILLFFTAFNILCEHRLEVGDLLLQRFLHRIGWSFCGSLSWVLQCSCLNGMWPRMLGLGVGHNGGSILGPSLGPRVLGAWWLYIVQCLAVLH